ncbi:MAG TPA: hypothetical protein P5123_08610, partial [Spirochaetota bacterium]|nr:hypothetical protein [Spirochaetota bacterium]
MSNFHKLLFLFSLFCFFSCDSSDSNTDKTPEVNQNIGNNVTAVVVTNINGKSTGLAESVGTLPSPMPKENSIIFHTESTPTTAIRGRHNLTNYSNIYDSNPPKRFAKTSRGLSQLDNNHTFWALDKNDDPIQINANLEYGSSTSKCLIYVADDYSGSFTNWDSIGLFFDQTVSPRMLTGFGSPTDVDSNGKVIILYYDMDYPTYLGFFNPIDLFSSEDANSIGRKSNEMEIFYMNYTWGTSSGSPEPDPDHPEMLRTLPHEFQHMIYFDEHYNRGV